MSEISISIKEKISYGLGDTGCNLVWQTLMLFMAYFYTDVFGLSPLHMGTMFLAVRVIDAVTDVIMGAIADRTRSRFGQFRPYLLWFAIPFGVLCTLTFYTPDFSYTGKLVYAYISYTLLSLVYTAINVPYCAMINNLSRDPRERISLQSWRFALSTLGGLIVSLSALPLVKYLGHGNLQQGYFYAMMVMGSLSIIFFYICFANTRERYIPAADTQHHSIWSDFQVLCASKDWRLLFTLNVVNLIAVIFKGGSALYYINSVMHRPDLATPLLTLTLIAGIVGALLSPIIFKNTDKVLGFKLAMAVEAILLCLFYFIPPSQIMLVCTMIFLINVIQLAATPLQWSMLSDVIDVEERVSGRHLSGIVFSTNLFAIKMGIAIGGALIGWLLAWGNYIGGAAVQGNNALLMITLLFTVLPGILTFSLILIMHGYSLNDKKLALLLAHSVVPFPENTLSDNAHRRADI